MIIVILAAVAIAAGTWLGAPTMAPILAGIAIGLGWPRYAARRAAAAGVLAWATLLLVAQFRGDAVAAFSATLGGAMGIPGWAVFFATLLYPAILASSAAWLAHLVGLRRANVIDTGAPGAPRTSHT